MNSDIVTHVTITTQYAERWWRRRRSFFTLAFPNEIARVIHRGNPFSSPTLMLGLVLLNLVMNIHVVSANPPSEQTSRNSNAYVEYSSSTSNHATTTELLNENTDIWKQHLKIEKLRVQRQKKGKQEMEVSADTKMMKEPVQISPFLSPPSSLLPLFSFIPSTPTLSSSQTISMDDEEVIESNGDKEENTLISSPMNRETDLYGMTRCFQTKGKLYKLLKTREDEGE